MIKYDRNLIIPSTPVFKISKMLEKILFKKKNCQKILQVLFKKKEMN